MEARPSPRALENAPKIEQEWNRAGVIAKDPPELANEAGLEQPDHQFMKAEGLASPSRPVEETMPEELAVPED